jgi:hypothetical protein
LQVARAIGQREADPGGQVFDAALALPEMFQDFEAMGVSERLRDRREAGKYVLFQLPCLTSHLVSNNQSSE